MDILAIALTGRLSFNCRLRGLPRRPEPARSARPVRGSFCTQLFSPASDNLGMTLPREVVPGRDYMITRRCSERRFFLRPDAATNNAFIKSKWARIETLRRNRGFQERYRDAIRRHLAGIANVLFPFGTYWMSRFGKAACEAAEGLGLVEGNSLLPAPA